MINVMGQDAQVELFLKTADKGMLAHSFIITGPDGVGKSIFARFMASYILCLGENKPCGVCLNCVRVKNNNHPDVIVIAPKNSIGVDDIRNLTEKINTKPYESDKKVVIIKGADLITVQGQNAFLKTLEEPPLNTTIIMLAENINLILDTIKSRCQIYKLNRIPTGKVKEYLLSINVDEQKAELYSNLSDGIIGNALKMLDSKYQILRDETINIFSRIAQFNNLDFIKIEDFFTENKGNIDSVFDIIITLLRDISVFKNTLREDYCLNIDKIGVIRNLSGAFSHERLNKFLELFLSAKGNIDKNANFQMAVTVLLLDLQEV
ncbi:MAG: family ATPase [Caloramator sp.]|jgi:DNA polymerase-3 subunit delta'|uniref:DNA polymerase III subunit n=1 Tax=Caloramator sp. TaxID=1871330 RepID=UPI001D711E3B|nr:DNA polymerase III subunit delta' C-terminal domain-containing protein [Caloramator sp.]MBZ4664174.1 family ATPase [Caloramator sp.]